MSLVIEIISNGTSLNPNGSPFGIFRDDTDDHIKDVVFAYNTIVKFYPPFVKVVRKSGIVQITSIIDTLRQIDELSTLYFDPFGIEELFERFDDYSLSMEQFIMAVEYTLFEVLETPKQLLNDTSSLDTLENDIRTYLTSNVKKEQLKLAKVFKVAYQNSGPMEQVNGKYTNATSTYTLSPLKLIEIFNKFELDADFPFLAFFNDVTGLVMKVSSELLDGRVSKADVRNWVISNGNYRKIKGLLIKHIASNYQITINCLASGVLTAKYESKTFLDYTDLVSLLNSVVNNVATKMGVTVTEEHGLSTVSGLIETSKRIDLQNLKRQFEDYPELPFVTKNLTTEESASFVYRSTITVNVKRNVHAADSSYIMIYSGGSIEQINTVVMYILLLDSFASKVRSTNRFMSLLESEPLDEPVREKGKVKMLRQKTGLKIDSKKCQRERQPVIVESDSNLPEVNPPSYILEYRGVKYMCPKTSVPYPGFNVDNTPCCFKKPQKEKASYLRNVPQDIKFFQPSNHAVTVSIGSRTYTTYLLKRDSRLYVPISTAEFVDVTDTIEEPDDSVWLEPVTESSLSKSNCPFQPDFTKISDDIHGPCSHHTKNKYFGYNAKGVPCCFRTDKFKGRANPSEPSTSTGIGYILQKDKILKPGQIGVLGDLIAQVISKIDRNKKYYKIGVETGMGKYASFLNAVSYATGNPLTELQMYSSKSFQQLFTQVRALTGVNIVILDIPYVPSKTVIELDYSQTKIYCGDYQIVDDNKACVIIIRKGDMCEVVVELNEQEDAVQTRLHKDVPLTKLLTDYFRATCVKRLDYPESYPFSSLPDISQVASSIRLQIVNAHFRTEYVVVESGLAVPIHETKVRKGIPIEYFMEYRDWLSYEDTIKLSSSVKFTDNIRMEIKSVTLDSQGQVTAVLSNFGQLVPVIPKKYTGDLPVLPYKFYKDINTVLRPPAKIVIGSILLNSTATMYVRQNIRDKDKLFALIQKGVTRLLEKGRLQKPLTNDEMESVVAFFTTNTSVDTVSRSSNNQTKYTGTVTAFKNHVSTVAKKMSKYTSTHVSIANKLKDIVLDKQQSRSQRIRHVGEILKKIPTGEDTSDFVIDLIAADIVSDPEEMAFINNNLFNNISPENVYLRENDTALFNFSDFERWLDNM
ncbi:hypothetical protein EB118_03575 [bacterium]|nr:hypothetical protein [bacterium]NDC94060.1 hypothetical protein [bacterium]NDD82746.1 hypothetical protein [bacterium]NDG29166.1 hypothetical protein [bacterium]